MDCHAIQGWGRGHGGGRAVKDRADSSSPRGAGASFPPRPAGNRHGPGTPSQAHRSASASRPVPPRRTGSAAPHTPSSSPRFRFSAFRPSAVIRTEPTPPPSRSSSRRIRYEPVSGRRVERALSQPAEGLAPIDASNSAHTSVRPDRPAHRAHREEPVSRLAVRPGRRPRWARTFPRYRGRPWIVPPRRSRAGARHPDVTGAGEAHAVHARIRRVNSHGSRLPINASSAALSSENSSASRR